MCRAPPPRAALSRSTCRRSPVPPLPQAALASPRLATLPGYLPEPLFATARRRCNPTNATSCSLQIPRVALWPAAALVLPDAVFRARHAIPAATQAPPRPPHMPSTPNTASLTHCALSSNLKHVLSSKCIPSSASAPTISLPFLFPDPVPYRTSAAATARRRQPPPLPPSPDPVLLEHHRDPLVLPSPSNFILPRPNIIFHSAGKLKPASAQPRRRPNATLSLSPNPWY
jgi:hypothetical protein